MVAHTHTQVSGLVFDEINRRVADTIDEAIQKGADPQAVISAVVITASDFAQLLLGEAGLDDLKETLEIQRGKPLPNLGG